MSLGESPKKTNECGVERELKEFLHATTVEHSLCNLGDYCRQHEDGRFPYGDAGSGQELPSGQIEFLPDKES